MRQSGVDQSAKKRSRRSSIALRRGGLVRESESSFLFVLILQFIWLPSNGQDAVYPKNPTRSPATIQSQFLVIGAQVVDAQWPTTTDLVNAPADLDQIEPGQCVSVVVIATGDGR